MFHGGGGGGWWVYVWGDDEARKRDDEARKQKSFDWGLLRRVLDYARPYWWHIAGILALILVTTGLGLLTPLIFRDLIDNALTNGDGNRLNWLALGLVAIPVISGLIAVVQRRLNAAVGEGVIFDLRVSLYQHIQRMAIRFFTNTKTGELMSRLNNDVVGAQRAISSTIVTIISNLITVIATLAVMLALEWRLTIVAADHSWRTGTPLLHSGGAVAGRQTPPDRPRANGI